MIPGLSGCPLDSGTCSSARWPLPRSLWSRLLQQAADATRRQVDMPSNRHPHATESLADPAGSRGCGLGKMADPPWKQLLEFAKDGTGNDIETILSSGSINIHAEEPGSGVTAICVAADAGNLSTTTQLLKMGANYTSPCTANGNTPAHFAARQGHVAVLKIFEERGLDLLSLRNSVVRFSGLNRSLV